MLFFVLSLLFMVGGIAGCFAAYWATNIVQAWAIIILSLMSGFVLSLIFATLYDMERKIKKLEEQNQEQQKTIENLKNENK